MNYAAVFLVFILGCAAIFWYAGGRRYYTGPIVEAQAEDEQSSEGDAPVEGKLDKSMDV